MLCGALPVQTSHRKAVILSQCKARRATSSLTYTHSQTLEERVLELLFYQFVSYGASLVNLTQEGMYSLLCPCLWFVISFQLRNEFVGLLSSLCTCGGFVEIHFVSRSITTRALVLSEQSASFGGTWNAPGNKTLRWGCAGETYCVTGPALSRPVQRLELML